MVLYPTTLGDEITFLFCFFANPRKRKAWAGLKSLKVERDRR